MLELLVSHIAGDLSLELSDVSIYDGEKVGCHDVSMLRLCSKGIAVNTLMYKADLDAVEHGDDSDRFEIRTKLALYRLKSLVERYPA